MTEPSDERSKSVLEPMERISEVLFGLIMVLTFTCSLRVTGLDRGHVDTMLKAAIGCNLAWGIIDALFYLLDCMSERGHNRKIFQQVRALAEPAAGRRIIVEALPPIVASNLPENDIELLRQKILQLPGEYKQNWLTSEDWRGALGVFLLVFLSTFPVVIPFIFLHEPRLALRISNAIAIVMLFMAGYAFGRYAADHPWRIGVGMVLLGGIMVSITIAFGG
jgi:VIT family